MGEKGAGNGLFDIAGFGVRIHLIHFSLFVLLRQPIFLRDFFSSEANRRLTFFTSLAGERDSGRMPLASTVSRTAWPLAARTKIDHFVYVNKMVRNEATR